MLERIDWLTVRVENNNYKILVLIHFVDCKNGINNK